MDRIMGIVVVLNRIANSIGLILFAPLGYLPEWLAASLVALVTGLVMLVAFKYTSHQAAIKQVRNRMKSELLALSLFKDSVAVSLKSQLAIVIGALKMMVLSLVPIACMIIPITLLLGQLSLWWQSRPLHPGEEAVVTLTLAEGDERARWPKIHLEPSDAAETILGPVRIRSQRAICWNLRAMTSGVHDLVFRVDEDPVHKQLAIGDRPMRVSSRRPDWNWSDILLYPAEDPFGPGSVVRSIEIQYPSRSGWLTGRSTWLLFWFFGSTGSALLFRGTLKVNF